MALRPAGVDLPAVLRRVGHPPIGERAFWAIQGAIAVIAAVHLEVDLHSSLETGNFPVGIPVALLILPVTYAALRYGLAGSAATGLWATLLWLPDLLLPHDQGHIGGDLVNLALVDFVAFVIGLRIEAERLARVLAERATAERLAIETRYRQLFETSRTPIVVLDGRRSVVDANPAALAVFGRDALDDAVSACLGGQGAPTGEGALRVTLPGGREYRVDPVALPASAVPGAGALQVNFEDVTEERREGRRATRYAALVVKAEEEQRQRLARELHDEPLQLFLHLARRLESLGEAPGVPAGVASGLAEAHSQALDAARRLRTLARDLRPPALDRLGLVAALSSLLADVEEEAELVAELRVSGVETRLPPEVELGAFRIGEGAVRNAVRHAEARELRVRLHFGRGELALAVGDDGRGFRPVVSDELVTGGHLGLLGMAERARVLGGRLDVRSGPGEGTTIEVRVPFAE